MPGMGFSSAALVAGGPGQKVSVVRRVKTILTSQGIAFKPSAIQGGGFSFGEPYPEDPNELITFAEVEADPPIADEPDPFAQKGLQMLVDGSERLLAVATAHGHAVEAGTVREERIEVLVPGAAVVQEAPNPVLAESRIRPVIVGPGRRR